MSNYKVENIGKIARVKDKKVFLHDILGLTSSEISISTMKAGEKSAFAHKHKQNEEIYIFLHGKGSMVLDEKMINVEEGTCIKVSPSVSRLIICEDDMEYICIQAKENSLTQFTGADAIIL